MNIEFKPFEFPSWEEYLKYSAIQIRVRKEVKCPFTNVDLIRVFFEDNLQVLKASYWANDGSKRCQEFKIFDLTEQGYKEACQLVNDKKLELAKAFAK